MLLRIAVLPLLVLAAAGCTGRQVTWRPVDQTAARQTADDLDWRPKGQAEPADDEPPAAKPPVDEPPAADLPAEELPLPEREPAEPEAEEVDPAEREEVLELREVVDAVHRAFPLLQAAFLQRDIAFGQHLAAQGAFDLRLRGASENAPLGFYRNYRQNIWVEQPTWFGGNVFTGYRIGRGLIQPWYGERVTDDGGEFRAGMGMPLLRNVAIDARRAQLFRTQLGREIAEQDIRGQRIDFVLAASQAYWNWVAAGRRYDIAESLLKIAADRHDAIRRLVETGDLEPPVLADNQRLIVSREAGLIESRQRLETAAIILSLYYRDGRGEPIIVGYRRLPEFPTPEEIDDERLEADIEAAWANRPDLQMIDLVREQTGVDLAEARNDLLPDLQATLHTSQDVGTPASPLRDKSQFELEAGLLLDVPVQRRFGRGRVAASQGRLTQLSANRRMIEDQIETDVRNVYAALLAAYEQVGRARESVQLALELAEIERRRFELGESDLLMVNLREQQAAEAESLLVTALYEYFAALAKYRAALALD